MLSRTAFSALLAIALSAVQPVFAEPFWGDIASRPVETDPDLLKPGQFIWKGEAIPLGPTVVVVSLTEQRAYVYRNGVRIGVSSVSTGKAGHTTPTGVFTVLQKDRSHHSKTYNNAPMPFTERLTWDGVALHAGDLPGYPSSHGCVHLPSEFARLLFEASPMGMTVVVASQRQEPDEVVHPAPLAPVDATTGNVVRVPRLGAHEDFRWSPEKAPDGPLSIVMSRADRRVLVYRNGIEIGRAKLALQDPKRPLGTHAYIMQDGWGSGASPLRQDAPAHRWLAVGIPGHAREGGRALKPGDIERISLPPRFAQAVYGALEPGATLLVTDGPVLAQRTTGVAMNIMNADPPG
jgi:hypothetical protein